MSFTATTNLSLPLIDTGTESGTWGELVDNGLTSYLDIAIAGGLSVPITIADVTLANTAGTSSATGITSTTAQYAILNVSGAMTAARSLILPSSSRTYVINNSCTGGYLLTVKGAATTGITVQNGERVHVAWNGSDYVKVGPGITSAGDTNDLRSVQGVTLGKGNNTISTNTAYGVTALQSVIPVVGDYSSYNTAIGYQALQLNNNGYSNTALGAFTLKRNTLGYENVAVGDGAMAFITTGWDNIAIGCNAMLDSVDAAFNTAIGTRALEDCVSGLRNTAIGQQALNTTTVSDNTAVGFQAAFFTTTGTYNVAVGSTALLTNVTGSYNTALGYGALNASTTDGNTAVGYNALTLASTGVNNTAVGSVSMTAITTGFSNVAVGNGTLNTEGTGRYNVAIGDGAMSQSLGSWDNIAIGYQALKGSTTASFNNIAIGSSALSLNTTGNNNTALGKGALLKPTASSNNVAIGANAIGGASASGAHNTAIGTSAGQAITTGSGNVIVGGFTAAGANAPAFSVTTENNRVSVGSTSTTNAYVQVAWTVVSDARDKTDFADVPHGLDFVSKLQPTAYRYKETRDATEGHGPLRYGFKAQDVLALEGDTPVIVDAGTPDKLYFNDQALIAVLVNAIKELKAEFDAYKATHP